MSDEGYDLTIPPGLAAYPDDQPLYRAIIYDNWLKKNNTEVQHALFYRREKDSKGLSVDTTPQACKANFHEPIFGLIDISASQIRQVVTKNESYDHLDVVPVSTTHGNIKRVPYRNTENDQIEATYIAKELAKRVHVYEHYRAINSPNAQI